MLEVFVSSDENSIQMGQKWLDNITNSLKNCSVEVILCSPQSIKRPWINFEAGAGWIRDIPVIPLCHSGMEPSQLPMPLNLLQAAKATEISSLKLIFPVLANALQAQTPNIDFTDFTNFVKDFEASYTFWDACNHAFAQLHQIYPGCIDTLKSGQIVKLSITETQFNNLVNIVSFLSGKNILSVEKTGGMNMNGRDTLYQSGLIPLPKLGEILSDPKFKLPS